MAQQQVQQSLRGQPHFFYGYVIVAVGLLTLLIMFGIYNTFGVFLTPVLDDFGWTRALLSGAFSISWIVYGLMAIIMGVLNDRIGPRIIITLCALLMGGGYILMSKISAVWQVYLLYGLMIGAGSSGNWVPLMSTVARWFVRFRGLMTGIVATGIGIGVLIAAPLTSLLISTFNWRMSYMILGAIILVLVSSTAQLLKRDPSTLGMLPYGASENADNRPKSMDSEYSLSEAVHFKQFWIVYGIFLCFGFCLYSALAHVVPHAIDLGVSAHVAASILATSGGLSIIGKILLGSAADRFGSKTVFIIGFATLSVAFLWLLAARNEWTLYLFAIAFGVAYGGCAAVESTLVAELFGLKAHGLLLGIFVLGFSLGAAAGSFIPGYIYDLKGTYQIAFVIDAIAGFFGLVLSMMLRPIYINAKNWTKYS